MTSSSNEMDRRGFLKTTTAAGLSAMAASPGVAPYLRFGGSPSEKVVVAVLGVNGRGVVHAQNFAKLPNSEVAYICDVDANVVSKGVNAVTKTQGAKAPRVVGDFRRILDDPSVDALAMATPDHWHAPMTLLAMQAGKHVFLEKPCGHNAREDELLMEAARKYDKLKVQLGTQGRSGPHFFDAIAAVREGIIGTPYLARTWYANTRVGIGKGKPVPVPPNLDYELWQGPAPREPYRDNIIHYNWHWFTTWGTGEICNNGTHEIDLARWFLGVDYPTTVHAVGGRFHFADDWQFPDTMDAVFEFEGGKTITWHGQSCNGLRMYGRERGVMILGTAGSLIMDRDGWVVSDLRNKVMKEAVAAAKGDALNITGDDSATVLHMQNFLDAIRTGAKLNAPIEDGAKTGLVCHLGTISHQTGRKLRTDPRTGHIVGDADAMKLWSRTYAPGWQPAV